MDYPKDIMCPHPGDDVLNKIKEENRAKAQKKTSTKIGAEPPRKRNKRATTIKNKKK